MDLAEYIDAANVTLGIEPGPVDEVLRQVVDPLVEAGEVGDPDELVGRLVRREDLQSTGIGSGMAVPHCLWEELPGPRVLVGVCPEGTDYHALDDRPVQLLFLLLSPGDAVRRHVRLLARIARLTRRPGLLERIRSADDPADAVRALRSEERERL
jgi:mannitol/fructose-specific phosphotransferase system IIA component (Ntr-type)